MPVHASSGTNPVIKQPKHIFHVLPFLFPVPQDRAVPTIGKPGEVFIAFHLSRTQGVQVDVTNQFQQVRLCLAEDRFIPVLEKMALPPVPQVETDGVARKQSLHYRRKGGCSCSEKKVKMIWNQCPGITGCVRLRQYLAQAVQKIISIRITQEDFSPCDSPCDDMV
jgi:hypothetical protein